MMNLNHVRRAIVTLAAATGSALLAACGQLPAALPLSPSSTAVSADSSAAQSIASQAAFGGNYYGKVPEAETALNWSITIAGTGEITGSYYDSGSGGGVFSFVSGSLSGRVRDDGSLSISGKLVSVWSADGKGCGKEKCSGREQRNFRVAATVALDRSGNLAGTTTAGTPFVWYRQ